MTGEKPFFQDRRKRAGMIRRVGGLAAKLDTLDNELVALESELLTTERESVKALFLRHVIACHLEFISPLSKPDVGLMARTSGTEIQLANLRNLKLDLSNAPEIVQAAFADAAAITKAAMEAA